MTKEEMNAQLVVHEMEQREALKVEFDSLRPSVWRSILAIGSAMVSVGVILWFYPEFSEQPISYLLLVLIIGVSGQIHAESNRINKRIDVLYRMLKE